MDPQLYLETDSNLNSARVEEGIGRCYAASEVTRRNAALVLAEQEPIWPLGMYPILPEQYNNAPYPDYGGSTPPPQGWFYDRVKPKLGEGAGGGAGGVFVLDDAIVAFLTSQTLSDGSSWSIDLETDAKTVEQLSVAGQAAIAPPVWPPPE